jgi:hypothetical protein
MTVGSLMLGQRDDPCCGREQDFMKFPRFGWFVIITALLVTACIPVINKPSYPVEWPPASSERIGACPVIAGTYAGKGSLYIEAGIRCPRPRDREGWWNCDLQLAPNLGIGSPAVMVEIAQPDAEAINVRLLDDTGAAQETRTLHLNKEYQCDAESLYFTSTGSSAEIRALSGAAFQHRREFSRDAKGELVMTVRDDMQALIVFIGMVRSEISYVRWMPAEATKTSAGKAP